MELLQNAENWRSINNYIKYEVSTHGRVRNAKSGRILKPQTDSDGYLFVRLSKDGKCKNHKIHRLIAQEFIDNPHNKPCVDHINRDRKDNFLDNLRWCTASENSRNKTKRKDNSSGINGVCYNKSGNRWQTEICNNEGKRIHKSFSCSKHPDAKERAIAWRKQKEQELGYCGE
jgi:hypothetical protein